MEVDAEACPRKDGDIQEWSYSQKYDKGWVTWVSVSRQLKPQCKPKRRGIIPADQGVKIRAAYSDRGMSFERSHRSLAFSQ